MGRPVSKKFFGDPASAGYQIAVSAWFTGEGAPEAAYIVSQRSNSVYIVTNDGTTNVESLKLVEGAPAAAGQMQVVVQPEGTMPFLTAAQAETDYDGAGDNGTFVGGTGYSDGDVITLSNGATITVDAQAAGVVTEFAVTTVGSSVAAGTTLTQDSVAPAGGTGFTLTPGDDNINDVAAPEESARIINQRVVKTFEGNIYNWPVDADSVERVQADIGS